MWRGKPHFSALDIGEPAVTITDFPHNATFVIGAESANVINVVIQLLDSQNNDLALRGDVRGYLSSDANGDALATAPNSGIAIGTDGLMIETLANQAFWLTSESDGDIDVDITETATPTFYIVLVMPNGQRVISAAIIFA